MVDHPVAGNEDLSVRRNFVLQQLRDQPAAQSATSQSLRVLEKLPAQPARRSGPIGGHEFQDFKSA